MGNTDGMLKSLISRITIWAEKQARLALKNGNPLDTRGIELALRAGVQHPEEVSLVVLPQLPTSEAPHLKLALEQLSIVTPDTAGLTIGYAIFLCGNSIDERQLAHQLKHVAQFESCEGIPGFFEKYISEVNEYGCANAPLEVEAAEFASQSPWSQPKPK